MALQDIESTRAPESIGTLGLVEMIRQAHPNPQGMLSQLLDRVEASLDKQSSAAFRVRQP